MKCQKKSTPARKIITKSTPTNPQAVTALSDLPSTPPRSAARSAHKGGKGRHLFCFQTNVPRLREHALSGDRPRRGVCSPTATLAKQLETSWLRSGSRSYNEPPPRESPGPQRCQSEPPSRPPRSKQKRQRRRGRRPAPPGRGGPRGRVGARGAGGTRRGSRAQVAGAGPAWRLRAGALEPAVTAPRGAATHRLAPRPPPRRRSSLQPRAPHSPIYRLGARGRAGGSRRPRRPRPPPGSGRRRCPPARAASFSQPLHSRRRRRRRGALLLASRVRRTPGSARARARGVSPPPPHRAPGLAPPLGRGPAARCCRQRAPRPGPLGSPWSGARPPRSV